ncbi:Hypothetical predicted protein [Xyrichtys novacula]|uniref:Uncharacterized protein n=1 Tax=Xyrichtys novacula TaxID=13765 RepID=A0AAV1FUX1_XYRNO|nr:Hypothetical predicted protein [Xyrichtys novacula]
MLTKCFNIPVFELKVTAEESQCQQAHVGTTAPLPKTRIYFIQYMCRMSYVLKHTVKLQENRPLGVQRQHRQQQQESKVGLWVRVTLTGDHRAADGQDRLSARFVIITVDITSSEVKK